jgi:hypothetical protein
MPEKRTEEELINEVLAIFERHLSQFPAEEQKRRWDALEEYVKKCHHSS